MARWGKDCGNGPTMGQLRTAVADAIEADGGADAVTNGECAATTMRVLDEMFIDGAWDFVFEEHPTLRRDIYGLAAAMYAEGRHRQLDEMHAACQAAGLLGAEVPGRWAQLRRNLADDQEEAKDT